MSNKHIQDKLKEFDEKLYEEFWKEGGMAATDFAKNFLQKALEDAYQGGWNKGNIDGQEIGVRNERKKFVDKHIPEAYQKGLNEK